MQIVAVGASHLRRLQCVQNWLVVLVHQHRHTPAALLMQGPNQVAEPRRRGVVARLDMCRPFNRVDLGHGFPVHVARFLEAAGAEAQADHGMANGPVPPAVDVEPFEQRLVGLEQLLERVHEQALAETSRAGEEVVPALGDQPPDEPRLVDVVAVILADRAESLDADGQLAFAHGCTSHGTNRRREERLYQLHDGYGPPSVLNCRRARPGTRSRSGSALRIA